MDAFTLTSYTQQWLDGIDAIGQRLLARAECWPMPPGMVDEHCFLIAVNQSRLWSQKLADAQPALRAVVTQYRHALPDIRVIRNQREHGIEHMSGTGRHQDSYVLTIEVNADQLGVEIDASSTVICDEGYLIGGRVNVQATMAAAHTLRAALPSAP